jgi:hypothetical protein
MGDKGKVSQIRPFEPVREGQEQDDTSRDEGGRRRRRSRSSYKAERKLQRLQMGLVVLISLAVLGTVIGAVLVNRAATERDKAVFEARQLKRELATVTEEANRLRKERDGLVKERIPGLQLLAYDETIQIGVQYVRNIAFTLVRQDGDDAYEYRIVLSNTGIEGVRPQVAIAFFDELGLQVGNAVLSAEQLAEEGEEYLLEPGEVRTHTGTIEVSKDAAPMYFLLTVE